MSDRIRTAPDVAWRHTGAGHSSSFRCGMCGEGASQIGRRMLIVAGARLFCCASCVAAAPELGLPERLRRMAADRGGFERADLNSTMAPNVRGEARQLLEQMLADGRLVQGRHPTGTLRSVQRVFADREALAAWQAAPLAEAKRMDRTRLQRKAAPVRPLLPAARPAWAGEVKRTVCPSHPFDARFQVDPASRPFGAGFAAAGVGRDVLTGKAWGA